ncbi:hypothetical protein [Georgenia muralis]
MALYDRKKFLRALAADSAELPLGDLGPGNLHRLVGGMGLAREALGPRGAIRPVPGRPTYAQLERMRRLFLDSGEPPKDASVDEVVALFAYEQADLQEPAASRLARTIALHIDTPYPPERA